MRMTSRLASEIQEIQAKLEKNECLELKEWMELLEMWNRQQQILVMFGTPIWSHLVYWARGYNDCQSERCFASQV
jgi:hypothetical protein